MGWKYTAGPHYCFRRKDNLISTLQRDTYLKRILKCVCMLGGGEKGKTADPAIPNTVAR